MNKILYSIGEKFSEYVAKISKNKFKWLVLIGLIIVVGIGLYLKKDKDAANETPKPSDIISQYQEQLPQLKEKAGNGSSVDLQNYAIAQYATGDVAGAEQTYRKQIEKGGENAMVHNNLANSLRDQKKYDEAVEEYKKAISQSPQTLTYYANLGGLYQYNLKDADRAVEIYLQGIEKNPDYVDLYVLVALVYEQKDDNEKAAEYFEKALELQESNGAAKAGLERMGIK